jgi:A/G-specific adenine glycosylase
MFSFTGFSEALILWYSLNKRDLPWRNTKNPYLIWISEIILQQTRVNQGIAYYNNITALYPTVFELASADNESIMRIWQGLGYYSRARNMHFAASQVVDEMGGVFPTNYQSLIKLKGVGRYTAAAIASIAGNEKVPVVDGNVYRVISRFYGIFTDISSHSAYNEFAEIVKINMGNANPGDFNQALMELGATVCTPSNTICKECPISDACYAFGNKVVHNFPVKVKNAKVKERFFNYMVVTSGNNVLIKKRVEKDIWTSLHDFPLFESNDYIDINDLLKSEIFQNLNIKDSYYKYSSNSYTHKLTHQLIHATFYRFDLPELFNIAVYKAVTFDQLKNIAIPRLIDKYLKNEFADKE